MQGGLDARYLLSQIQPEEYHPLSLLTLSTPHRGSDFMSWCRANIGVGAQEAQAAAKAALKEASDALPYSLKHPILSVTSPTAASADDKPPAFPNVGSALSAYMLKLLDSPAYSNLTPRYLADVFNPANPDREDIRYYSIGATAPDLGFWHPLWLPKTILDAADKKRAVEQGQARSLGNDGLVPVESSMWGEFLGVVEECDHWELRGAAGFRRPPLPLIIDNAKQALAGKLGTSAVAETKSPTDGDSWDWKDVNQNIESMSERAQSGKGGEAERSQEAGALRLASWISKRIPLARRSSDQPARPAQPTATQGPIESLEQDAPLLFSSKKTTTKPDRYTLERLYISLCRKLYDDGL